MKQLLWLLVLLSTVGSALAADNAVVVTPGSGVTMRSRDVGSGVQSSQVVLGDTSGTALTTTSSVLDIHIGSSAVAAGAYASGAFASGALAAGSMVDLLTMRGTKAPGTAAANSILTGGVYNSGGVTLTDGQQAATQLTSTGAANVNVTNTNANGQATMANSSPVAIASNQSSIPVAATQSGAFTVGQLGPYPVGATPYTATATGTTGATTATLTGASSVTTYLCGFSIRANATAAATGNATVTGVITATLNFTQWTAPNASGLGITEMIFAPCIPASTTNTSIAVVSAAPGTGGVVSVTAWGYKL